MVLARRDMGLNDWFRMFESIYYLSQNVERSQFKVFSHLVEVTGGLVKSVRKEDAAEARVWLAKTFSWYCALVRALGIEDLETVVWEKFPWLCPSCKAEECTCDSRGSRELDSKVRELARVRGIRKPGSLDGWQGMFERIYDQSGKRRTGGEGISPPGPHRENLVDMLLGLMEEIGELSEAMRLKPFHPEHLLNELADVFARICGTANALAPAFSIPPVLLSAVAWDHYPSRCRNCDKPICVCLPNPVRKLISGAGVYQASERDPLTGLYGRGRLEADLDWECRVRSSASLTVFFMDVDHFKSYNDEWPGGHAQGDEVLKYVARKIEEGSGGRGTVYRKSGDEFVVVLKGMDRPQVEQVACDIRHAVHSGRALSLDRQSEIPVTISLGIAMDPEGRMGWEQLDKEADSGMFEAKKAGRGRIAYASGELVSCTEQVR